MVYRRACGHVDVGTCPHQVLAATLTLSQPRGADYAHPLLVSTPSFESHRHAWYISNVYKKQFLRPVKILYFCLGWVEILMTPLH